MEAATQVSSFAKSLFLGEIHEELVFPFPLPEADDQQRTRELVQQVRDFGANYDPRKVEDDRWIGDDKIAELGERGLTGLYVPTEYGGQGLSQTGYCPVREGVAPNDAAPSVVMGGPQSIGMKGIPLFGSHEQKGRLLPHPAARRKPGP